MLQDLEMPFSAIHASTRTDSTITTLLGRHQAREVTSRLLLLDSALITLIVRAALLHP